jgi:hypothetical protein
MESYHLTRVHGGTVGPHSKVEEMVCPPGGEAFNYHLFSKESSLAIDNAHPRSTRLEGGWRRMKALVTIYPNHLITLTPGYLWYLSLQPRGVSAVHVVCGGGMAQEWLEDPDAKRHLAALETLVRGVNAEDRAAGEARVRVA